MKKVLTILNKKRLENLVLDKIQRGESLTIEESIECFKNGVRLRINKVPHVY